MSIFPLHSTASISNVIQFLLGIGCRAKVRLSRMNSCYV